MNNDLKPAQLIPPIVADVYELAGRLRDDGEWIAAGVGQTQARWQVLSAASADPMTVPQIARRLGVTRQNVQRIADRLVEERCVAYRPNPDHRGSPHLILLDKGRADLAKLTRAAGAYHQKIAARIERKELTAIHRHLRYLLGALAEMSGTDSQSRKSRQEE